ncbi:TetR/AcrR family transcriptional regulator [Haloactinospora alba]|uniref:TetR/AcrR family transcriptional regulator n=1 Tax=Haloactinospora alba TaxID=405555 RepID=UPI002482E9EF|nr:TetR family transcriptional regulator [Haloactinospora alba]
MSARSSLTQRRKAATQLDIARAAAALFAEQGVEATTAEEIAERAGVAVRTFYRYFPTKQDAVEPLLTAGGGQWRSLLESADAEQGVLAALEEAATRVLSVAPEQEAMLGWTRELLRAAGADAALRSVWQRVNRESEELLRPALTRLAGDTASELEVRLAAAAATDSIRVALETWAASEAGMSGPGCPADLAVRCLRHFSGGVPLLRPTQSSQVEPTATP